MNRWIFYYYPTSLASVVAPHAVVDIHFIASTHACQW